MIRRISAFAITVCCFGPMTGEANDITIRPELHIPQLNASVSGVESLQDQKEHGIFMQIKDYSCGAASLATLLHYYFGENTNEEMMLAHIERFYSAEEYKVIEDAGLSFLELEQIVQGLGFQSASVRLPADAIYKLPSPVIVYLERKDYQHFAVLKGAVGNRVYIADPSRGNIRLSVSKFLEEWDGRTFVVGHKDFTAPDLHSLSIVTGPYTAPETLAIQSRLLKQSPITLTKPILGRRP